MPPSESSPEDTGPSSGARPQALVASGAVMPPVDVTLGAVYTFRSQLPWSATAGRDLNGDGFNSDLVPGTTRDSGGFSLAAVNAWRAQNGLAPVNSSQIDSSRISEVDVRVSKTIPLVGSNETMQADGAGVQPVEHDEPAGAVQWWPHHQCALEELWVIVTASP